MQRRIKFLKIQLTSAIFALIIVLISGFFIFGPELTQVANAVLGDYDRAGSGDPQIETADWDQLDEDFLDKQDPAGDTMAGPLIVPEIDVTNINISGTCTGNCGGGGPVVSDIQNVAGNDLRMVCGSTPVGATAWEIYAPDPLALRVFKVNTGVAFTSTPTYIARLMGAYTYVTGNPTVRVPELDGFRFYTYFFGKDFDGLTPAGVSITPEQANAWGWYIEWCAIGE